MHFAIFFCLKLLFLFYIYIIIKLVENGKMVIIWEGHGIIISFLIIFFVFCVSAIPNYSYADDIGLGDLNSYAGTSTGKSKKYTDRMKKVFSILRVVGTILSVVILTAIGLKFMMGSVEEKAVPGTSAMY